MSVTRLDSLVQRLDETRSTLPNPHGVPVTLFANRDVPIELEAVEQALGFVALEGTIDDIAAWQRAGRTAAFWGDDAGRLERVVLTPDFHRGGGIPVGTVGEARGFVVPQAVGNDVCCGMRFLVTDITRDEIAQHLDTLHRPLRAAFFQGKREIPMSPRQREALLREGLLGLYETRGDNVGTGIWRHYDARAQEADLARVHFQGVLPARDVFAFADYIAGSGATDSRDSQIGSIGGGNHFVELQVIEEIHDGTVAHAWGVAASSLAIMAHSGSVGLGRARSSGRRVLPRSCARHLPPGDEAARSRLLYDPDARSARGARRAVPRCDAQRRELRVRQPAVPRPHDGPCAERGPRP